MVLEETKPLSKARVGKGENRVAFPQDYIVLDLETTGLSSDRDEIIEVSALKVHCGKIIDRYETLIHPFQEIPSFISDLTGITNDMVLNAPYFSDILSELIDFIGSLYIVGHNVNFDINFLYFVFPFQTIILGAVTYTPNAIKRIVACILTLHILQFVIIAN